MNVVVVVMDSLRADHVYGPRARTPTMDKVARQSLRFTRAYPEGMPTIPARRAIMAGRRTFPFRGWHPYRELPPQPGWEPVGSDGKTWTEVLREQGWTTGYVTDNPHLLLGVHKRFRRTFDRVELVDGQVPLRRKPKRRVEPRTRWRATCRRRCAARAPSRAWRPTSPPTRATAPRRTSSPRACSATAMSWIEWARTRQPFALVIDSFDAHEPWDAPRRLKDLYGRARRAARADPAVPHAGRQVRARSTSRQSILRRMRQLYAAEVTLVDAWLGHFLDRLANLGLDGQHAGRADLATTACCSASTAGSASATRRDPRRAEPRAVHDPPPARARPPGGRAATSPPPTTSARPCCRRSARTRRGTWTGSTSRRCSTAGSRAGRAPTAPPRTTTTWPPRTAAGC